MAVNRVKAERRGGGELGGWRRGVRGMGRERAIGGERDEAKSTTTIAGPGMTSVGFFHEVTGRCGVGGRHQREKRKIKRDRVEKLPMEFC